MLALIRNELVFKFRGKILDNAPMDDHGAFTDYVREFERVSYHEMVFKFWKPLRSFYNPNIIKQP